MSVRPYLRSPLALVWTLIAMLAVGGIFAASLRLVTLSARSPIAPDPAAPVSITGSLFTLVFVAGTLAVAAIAWLPCSLAIAYAVGSRIRNDPISFGDSIDLLRARVEPLYRWVKTRIAIDPIADRLLGENDVSPAEIAVGCGGFVVPALALDSPTLQTAVGRANRAIPQSGRERILLLGLGSTGLLVVVAITVGTGGGAFLPSARAFALAVAVVGSILTAALDTAWRVEAYLGQDLDEGFVR
jgi:hypothetical protein